MKCKRRECPNEHAEGHTYCSRECAPYGYMCGPSHEDRNQPEEKPFDTGNAPKTLREALDAWRAEQRARRSRAMP